MSSLTLCWKVELQLLPRLGPLHAAAAPCMTVITTVVVRAESSSHLTSQMTLLHLPGSHITYSLLHFSLSSSPLLSSSPVLPRTSVSLCHFPNFKVSQFICCHCEVKFNCLSLEVPLMWTVIPMICNAVNSSSWIFIWLSCLHTATDLLQLNDKNSCGVPVCVTKKQSW